VGSAIRRSDFGEELVVGELGRKFVPDITLNGVEGVDVVLAGKRNRLALGTDAGGAADAVDVVLGVLREIVVDDVADALDVETAAGDIGGNQNG
jgi:hypothetical protein